MATGFTGKRIPHFSNPRIAFQGNMTGTPTRDNAKVARMNRMHLADLGNETEECPAGGVLVLVNTFRCTLKYYG